MASPSTPVPSVQGPEELAGWLAGHQRLILGSILLFSIVVRVGFFLELNQGPCIWFHRWDQTDMNFFHEWAKLIASGNWLTDQKMCPEHSWYQTIGNRFLEEHPEQRAEIEREAQADGVTPSRAVWNRWYNKRFHQDPLYPYLLALHYKVLGEDHRWMFLWQLGGGVVANVLVYILARRCFGDLVGVVAAALACLCSTLLFYELVLLRESLIVSVGLGLVLLGDVLRRRERFWCWFLFGLAVGAASLLKNIFLPFLLLYLAALGWQCRRTPSVWLRAAAGSALGMALALSPVFARNAAVGAPVFALAGTGGTTYVCTNASDVDLGMQSGGPISYEHLSRIMGQTNGRMLPTIRETLKTHSVGSYLRLLGTKFGMLWTWFEVPDNCNYYHFKLFSTILRTMPVTYFLISPLALVGLGLALPRLRQCWPLYVYVFSLAALMMVFCSMSRWRLPLVAAVIPFASLTVVQISLWILYGQLARGVPALVVLIVVAVLTSLPLPPGAPLVRAADCSVTFSIYYVPQAEEAWKAGDSARVIAQFTDFVEREPLDLQKLRPARPAQYAYEVQLAQLYAEVRLALAKLLAESGQTQASLRHQQRAEELSLAAGLPWPPQAK